MFDIVTLFAIAAQERAANPIPAATLNQFREEQRVLLPVAGLRRVIRAFIHAV